jgi:DNA repair exonuclease SbcCD ATPase subunit
MDKSYASEKAAAEQKLVAERERSQNEFKEYGEQYNDKVSQGYSPDYVNSPSNYGTPQTVSTPLSPQQRLAVAMKNRMNPNERIASDARAEIEQGNTIAQNEARAAEKAITEATRQRERKEDIDTRASEFKALRDESAQKRKETAEAKPQLPPKGIEAQQDRLDKRASVNSITADLTGVLKDLETGRLVLGPRRNLENELKNKFGNSTPESIKYSSFLNTMEKMRNDVVRLNTGTQTEGDSQRAMNELMGSLGDTKNVKNRIGELIRLSKRAGDQHETAINTMRKEYGAEPMDFKSMASPKPIIGGSAAVALPTGTTVSNWKQ